MLLKWSECRFIAGSGEMGLGVGMGGSTVWPLIHYVFTQLEAAI